MFFDIKETLKIIIIGGITAEICNLEHFWSAILDCSIDVNIDYEQINIPVDINKRLIGKTRGLTTL